MSLPRPITARPPLASSSTRPRDIAHSSSSSSSDGRRTANSTPRAKTPTDRDERRSGGALDEAAYARLTAIEARLDAELPSLNDKLDQILALLHAESSGQVQTGRLRAPSASSGNHADRPPELHSTGSEPHSAGQDPATPPESPTHAARSPRKSMANTGTQDLAGVGGAGGAGAPAGGHSDAEEDDSDVEDDADAETEAQALVQKDDEAEKHENDLGPVVLNESDKNMINPRNTFRLCWDLGIIMPLLVYLTVVRPAPLHPLPHVAPPSPGRPRARRGVRKPLITDGPTRRLVVTLNSSSLLLPPDPSRAPPFPLVPSTPDHR
jgi:hypothetical protein